MAQSQSFQDMQQEFFDSTVNPEGTPFDTEISLVPPDTECKGTVASQRLITFKDKDDPSRTRAMVEYVFTINDPEVREETNLDEPRAVYLLGLDVTKDWNGEGSNPPLEFGKNKNVYLGRFLDAFKRNDGRPFKWSGFMHEECWIRTGRPRSSDDRYAPIVMLSSSKDKVAPRRR